MPKKNVSADVAENEKNIPVIPGASIENLILEVNGTQVLLSA